MFFQLYHSLLSFTWRLKLFLIIGNKTQYVKYLIKIMNKLTMTEFSPDIDSNTM